MKTGDKVICIDNSEQPCLVVNKEYIVLDVNTCRCGSLSINVGTTEMEMAISKKRGFKGFDVHCSLCNRVISVNIQYYKISRFRKLDESFAEQELEKVIKHFEKVEA